MFDLRLEARSGVPVYLQLVHQVKRAAALGMVQAGDQLPTVHEVVTSLLISPNTVLKAYRELERAGLVWSRPGLGTFVKRAAGKDQQRSSETLRRQAARFFRAARMAGLDDDAIDALLDLAREEVRAQGVA